MDTLLHMLKKVLVLTVLAAPAAFAQTAQPTTKPSATPTSLPVLVPVTPPPGFVRVEMNHYAVLCEPKDQAWVKEVLSNVKPANRPTTMPEELLTKIESQRQPLIDRIAKTLAVDPKEIGEYLDSRVIPQIKTLQELRPTVLLLVTTPDKLKEVMQGGWENPRLHYNRLSGEVTYNMNAGVANQEPILPSLYLPTVEEKKRRDDLDKAMSNVAAGIEGSVSSRAIGYVEGAFIQLVGDKGFIPLKAKEDQKWLGVGLSGILGARFAEQVTGFKASEVVQQMVAEPKGFPFPASKLDLLHPRDVASMRTEYVPYYLDGMRRKSTVVMNDWLEKAGEGAVPKLLTALRKDMPKDGEGLVKKIQEVSGIDLSKEVAPAQ